jgi:O-antigen ligase
MSAFVHAIKGPRLRGAGVSSRAREVSLIAGVWLMALALGFVLVHRSPALAFAVVLVPPLLWLLTRRSAGLIVGLGLILVLPYWETFGAAQASVLRVASIAAASTLLFERSRPRFSVSDFALIAFVVVVLLGWLLQYDYPHAGRVVSVELTPLGFYLGARCVDRNRLSWVTTTMVVAGTAGAVTVLYEYVHGSPVFVDPAVYDWKQSSAFIFRPGGIFGSPPGAATVLTFVILFGFAAVRNARGRHRAALTGCLLVCGVALLTTFTRANMIGLAVGILVFLWLMRSPLLRPTRAAWVVGTVGVALFFALPSIQNSTTFQKGIIRPGTLATRENYWSWALPIATSTPHNFIFGVGTAALETPQISSTAPVQGSVARDPQAYDGSLHSEYVTTLVEQGVIGLLALVFFLLAVAVAAGRRSRATGEPVYAAAVASIVAFAIAMTVGTDLLHGPSFAMLMVAAGLGVTGLKRPADDPGART